MMCTAKAVCCSPHMRDGALLGDLRLLCYCSLQRIQRIPICCCGMISGDEARRVVTQDFSRLCDKCEKDVTSDCHLAPALPNYSA